MEILIDLMTQDNYVAKREAMKALNTIFHDKDHNSAFWDYFIEEKSHLKCTMKALNDESSAIKNEAFHLLMIFLLAPEDKRGEKVNDTLRKNKGPLIQFIQIFYTDKEEDKDSEYWKQKTDTALEWLDNL